MSDEQTVIVGAGVAGLSLAIMLPQRGLESVVLESRADFGGPTSGVRISADGVRVLRLMKVEDVGEATRRVELRFGRVSSSFSAPASDVSAIAVTRLALHEQLLRRADALGVRVITRFKATHLIESADGVEVTSESHEKTAGRLLVGADGVGSTLRTLLNPSQPSTKKYAGYLGVGFITHEEAKVEMTLHNFPGHQVGIASCGKVSEAATRKSVFMWTHLRMPETDARLASRASVEAELTRRAQGWSRELRARYDQYRGDADAVLTFGPVYNSKPPDRWFSKRMILIGDAAHPYGPGGQGISMALKDAKAIADVIARGFSDADKTEFQRSRAEESRALGEAAEKRNAKDAASTALGVWAEGLKMKAVEIVTRGRLTF